MGRHLLDERLGAGFFQRRQHPLHLAPFQADPQLALRRRLVPPQGGLLEGVDDRQRPLSSLDVGTHRLAGLLAAAPDAEVVVARLERQSEGPAKTREVIEGDGVRGGDRGAAPGRGFGQRRGLAGRHLEVVVHAQVPPVLPAQVERLAFRHGQHRPRQGAHHAQRALGSDAAAGEAQRGFVHESLHVGAGVHGLRHAPQPPHGGPVPPLGVFVLQVIVDQGEVVDELDRGGGGDGRAGGSARGLACQQAEHTAELLAAIAPGQVPGQRLEAGRQPAQVVALNPVQLNAGGPGREYGFHLVLDPLDARFDPVAGRGFHAAPPGGCSPDHRDAPATGKISELSPGGSVLDYA